MSTANLAIAAGYRFAGIHCGLKAAGTPDLALIVSRPPATAAAVFTRNRFPAAPVLCGRRQIAAGGPVRAVLINAGNANACTGEQGEVDLLTTAAVLASVLECPREEVFISSTGVIGEPLPVTKILKGIEQLESAIGAETAAGSDGLEAAARAIMTTDKVPKLATATIEVGGERVTITGLAKGAGMIEPDMATMLAYLLTDAGIERDLLQAMLKRVVDQSFNRITVDGDTSTNDTVALLANGLAGGPLLEPGTPDYERFEDALTRVSIALAQAIVRDGEGATKFVTVQVSGLADNAAAHQVANAIATSPLVKTAIYGGDANWGRILAAAGYSGADFQPDAAELWITGGAQADAYLPSLHLVSQGMPLDYDEAAATERFAQPELLIDLKLGDGPGQTVMWTCDLSHEYVTINGAYRT